MKNEILLACGAHVLGGVIVWFKANAKTQFGIELGPIAWWLILGWAVEYLYLTAWWTLSEATSPWNAHITIMAIGTVTSISLMSWFYGFHMKYIFAALLIVAGALVSRFDFSS